MRKMVRWLQRGRGWGEKEGPLCDEGGGIRYSLEKQVEGGRASQRPEAPHCVRQPPTEPQENPQML